jgi:putative PEP-CTERM system TPR-repeat lipoprotein
MLEPGYVPAALGLAKLDLDESDPLNARRRLERLLRDDPRKVDALVALAELGPAINASEEEIRHWLLDAQKIDPSAPKPAILLARLHLKSGDPQSALAVARAAQRSNPEQPELLDVLAVAQMNSGNASDALGTYAQLAALIPNSAKVLYRLAKAQSAAQSDVAARITLEKVLALQPDHPGALGALAEIHVRAGRNSDAIAIARRLQAKPDSAAAGFTLEGDAMLTSGNAAAAVTAYERAQQLTPASHRLLRLHTALERAGRLNEADARARHWITNRPADRDVRLFFADVMLRRGNYAEAKDHYLIAENAKLNDAAVLNNLAWTMLHTNDGRARDYAERAFKLNPEDPAILDTLGWILTQAGELARGIELLQLSVTRAPTAPDARIHLAQVLLNSGNYTRARSELEAAAKGNPSSHKLAEIKQLLQRIPR